jgi:hypothetical protein
MMDGFTCAIFMVEAALYKRFATKVEFQIHNW